MACPQLEGWLIVVGLLLCVPAGASPPLPEFRQGPWWGEQRLEEHTQDGVRLLYDAPANLDPARPTLVVFYATPNGNTAEQTLGCAMAPGLDWHYDIQHIAAQTRALRRLDRRRNIALVVAQPDERSWPSWRSHHPDNGARIRAIVDSAVARFPGASRSIALTGHSGGGSFVFGYINGADAIPPSVERIALLDANYAYDDAQQHGDKLLAWLADPAHRLVVLAYDDRNITLDGKPVVGPTGGTFRATGRMEARFRQSTALAEHVEGDVRTVEGLKGRLCMRVDANPANKILHTVLVETNGFLEAMTRGTRYHNRGFRWRGPRAYAQWIQPSEPSAPVGPEPLPGIPSRAPDAEPGSAFMARIAAMPPAAREAAIGDAILAGNVPSFLRSFKRLEARCVDARGRSHTATFSVAPDYLAVGSDADWVRVPMTPMTAARIAGAWDCSLPTRRIVDIVDRCAEVRLEPHPLTEEREAVPTFARHNAIIEGQRMAGPPGALVCGIKKDLVLTNRLSEKPHRVAIYGWRLPNGLPIQPLTTVHKDTYVDYSHGVRLVSRRVTVDGRPRDLAETLKDATLWPLFSDEGPIR